MLKELLDAIYDRAAAVKKLDIVKPPAEPDHIYYTVGSEGEAERHHADPKPRDHAAFSLQAITEKVKEQDVGSPVVWYCREKVVGLLNDGDRRDRVTLTLAFAEPLLIVIKALAGKAFTQRELILLLRSKFKNCLDKCGELLNIIRGVKFQVNQAGDATIAHGKSSVGKSLTMEMNGVGSIPEYITLLVPVFENAGLNVFRYPVQLALEPDPASQTFQLLPLPGEVENAIAAAEDHIAELLRSQLEGVPILYGKP